MTSATPFRFLPRERLKKYSVMNDFGFMKWDEAPARKYCCCACVRVCACVGTINMRQGYKTPRCVARRDGEVNASVLLLAGDKCEVVEKKSERTVAEIYHHLKGLIRDASCCSGQVRFTLSSSQERSTHPSKFCVFLRQVFCFIQISMSNRMLQEFRSNGNSACHHLSVLWRCVEYCALLLVWNSSVLYLISSLISI